MSSFTNILDPATSETKPWEFIKSENGTSENSQSPWGESVRNLLRQGEAVFPAQVKVTLARVYEAPVTTASRY